MNYKKILAELANKEELSTKEFRNLKEYKELEKNPDLIGKIQEYHLPEINRLICTSDKLLNEPWAKWYRVVSDIVRTDSDTKNDVLLEMTKNVLNMCREEKCFDAIIALEDDIVIGSFFMYFEKLKNERNKMKSQAREIERVIKQRAENNGNDSIGKEDNLIEKYKGKSDDELNNLCENIKGEIAACDDYLNINEEYIAKIEKIGNADIDFNTRRENVYDIVKEIVVPDAVIFIREYMRSGKISREYNELLKNNDFILEIYDYLGKQPDKICPVVEHLVGDGVVDIRSKECMKLLIDTPVKYISSYLFNDYKDTKVICGNIVNSLLWDIIIDKEIKSDTVLFYDLWAVVSDEESWNYIVEKIKDIDEVNFHLHIVKFMSDDNFRSPDIIANIIATNRDVNFREKLWDVCERLLENKDKHNFLTAIYNELKIRDQSKRQIIIEQEAEKHRFIQNLFGEIYRPIDNLELFAYNLRKGDITYSKKLVLSELTNSIIELRYGLSAMGLDSLEDEELWKNQSKVKYNSSKHVISNMPKDKPSEVLLKTIGFSYENEEGNKTYHKAEVDVVSKKTSDNSNLNNNRSNTNTTVVKEWYDPVCKRGSKR